MEAALPHAYEYDHPFNSAKMLLGRLNSGIEDDTIWMKEWL